MTKDEALKIIKLLSALESWAFCAKNPLPDYLHEDLADFSAKISYIFFQQYIYYFANTIYQVFANPCSNTIYNI
jgi:hypothetical protein